MRHKAHAGAAAKPAKKPAVKTAKAGRAGKAGKAGRKPTARKSAGRSITWFKSWYLVLAGMLLQVGYGLWFLKYGSDRGMGQAAFFLGGITVALVAAFGVIPLVLLIFQRTRLLGGAAALGFGVAAVALKYGLPAGVLLLLASTFALWKKV